MDYKISFLLEPLIFEYGNNIIGAERGSGKTRFCISLGMSMTYDVPSFLGYPVKHGKVLFLNFEIHEPQFKLFFEPIQKHFSKYKKLHEFHSLSYLSYAGMQLQDMDTIIDHYQPDLLIVDSFKAFASRFLNAAKQKELNNLNVDLIYQILNRWKGDRNRTILVTNHTNKGTKGLKSHSDLMYGPSGLMDYADQTILIRKTDEPNQRLIAPDKNRYNSEQESDVKLVEIVSDNGEIWIDLLKENVSENEYMYTGEQVDTAERLRQVQELHEQGLSQRKIADQLGISNSTVNSYIKKINAVGRSGGHRTEQPDHQEQNETPF